MITILNFKPKATKWCDTGDFHKKIIIFHDGKLLKLIDFRGVEE